MISPKNREYRFLTITKSSFLIVFETKYTNGANGSLKIFEVLSTRFQNMEKKAQKANH